MKKIFIYAIIVLIVGFLALQLFPYGRRHTNPDVVAEPSWDSPHTRQLAERACFDCHSNETSWPWYSNIAPVSWLIQRDVEEGRNVLNFSEWTGRYHEVDEIPEVISYGAMPPSYFMVMHPNARLTAQEKQELITGMQKTLTSRASR